MGLGDLLPAVRIVNSDLFAFFFLSLFFAKLIAESTTRGEMVRGVDRGAGVGTLSVNVATDGGGVVHINPGEDIDEVLLNHNLQVSASRSRSVSQSSNRSEPIIDVVPVNPNDRLYVLRERLVDTLKDERVVRIFCLVCAPKWRGDVKIIAVCGFDSGTAVWWRSGWGLFK